MIKDSSSTMNSYSTQKRKGKPSQNPRTSVPRQNRPIDKTITIEGIYNNARFVQAATTLMGCLMQIQVKNGETYEGIFRTYSPQFEVVLEMVHRIDKNNPDALPTDEDITHKYIFKPQDIVMMNINNVDLDYATKDSFATDTAISKFNGKIEERQLEPWDDCIGDGADDALSSVNNDDANGWDVNEMFKTNKVVFGVTSTYDSSLDGYTVPLVKQDTEEYRDKAERAEKIANEIESSQGYKQRLELENGDEETLYSAVFRPGSDNSSTAKYIPPNRKKLTNKPPGGRPAPPQVQPQQISSSSIHSSNNSNISSSRSSGPMAIRTASPGRQPGQVPARNAAKPPPSQAEHTKTPPIDSRSGGVDKKPPLVPSEPSKVDTSAKPQPSLDKSKLADKATTSSHKPTKTEEIAGLKKFSNDFDMDGQKATDTSPPSPATASAPTAAVSAPAPTLQSKSEKNEAEDKLAATVKNSNLNPNAKEFVFNPMRSHTPRSPQTPTPPRPQATQSPIIPQMANPFAPHPVITPPMIHGQQAVFTSMAAALPGAHPSYVVTPAPAPVSIAPATYNQVFASGYGQNSRYRKAPALNHVAAATGPPLLAPVNTAASLQGGPTKITMQYPPQGIVPGGGQPPSVYQPTMYHVMGTRMVHPSTMTMVPTNAVSAINYDQHAPNAHMFCPASLAGHQTPSGGQQQAMVAPHSMVNHPTPPIQTQAATPGSGVHPSPSPVHHQANANQANMPPQAPPQPMVFHHGHQMGPPPPPPSAAQHQMQSNAPNQPVSQQGANPSHLHLSHANQHTMTFSTAAGPQQMVLLPQGSGAGIHQQAVIQTSSARTLQQAPHIHGTNPGGPAVGPNAVIAHHPSQMSVIQNQTTGQLHYMPQQPNQGAPAPTTAAVYHANQ